MPTARADTATTNANTAVRIAVLGNDSGSSLTILSITTPANGTARINTDKTITYTPRTGYTGTDTFRYTIRDGGREEVDQGDGHRAQPRAGRRRRQRRHRRQHAGEGRRARQRQRPRRARR